MDTLLNNIQPYLNAVSAILSVATLGFVLNLVRLAREAAADRVKIFEDRLASAKEDQERTEKWQKRERERLEADLKAKQDQLEAVLKGAGLDLSSLALGAGLKAAADGLREEVESLTEGIRTHLRQLPVTAPEASEVQDSAKLTLAKGDLVAGRWASAASLLDEVTKDEAITNWNQHFSRAVAHANARGGADSDLAALRAYNDAVAFAPSDLNTNRRARLFTYRGAIYKRLGRTDEALADLNLASTLATASYEIRDNLYNIACVHAIRGDRDPMLQALRELGQQGGSFSNVRAHLDDYFASFRNDEEFKALVGVKR